MGVSQELTHFEWKDAPVAQYAVIGDPIGHSLSPKMHRAAYEHDGLDLNYVGLRVPREEVSKALDHLRELGYVGVNVTLPLKEAVAEWLSDCDEFAARVNSVNTIRLKDRYGFNTDAEGFMETLRLLNVQPGTPTLLLGAGGSARALAAILSDESYPLRIWNRTRGRAESMVNELEIDAAVWSTPDVTGAGLIVNATSASLDGDGLDLDWDMALPGAIAYDIVYRSEPTPFLQQATEAGVRTVDGLGMLVMQGALAYEFWLDRPAPHAAMWEALR